MWAPLFITNYTCRCSVPLFYLWAKIYFNMNSIWLKSVWQVCRDPRWGRCYESYSEDTEIVRSMAKMIIGLQGSPPQDHPAGYPFLARGYELKSSSFPFPFPQLCFTIFLVFTINTIGGPPNPSPTSTFGCGLVGWQPRGHILGLILGHATLCTFMEMWATFSLSVGYLGSRLPLLGLREKRTKAIRNKPYCPRPNWRFRA